MIRIAGYATAAWAALAIATAAPTAAAPMATGAGVAVVEGTPAVAEEAHWRGRRVVVVHRYRPARFHRPYYRPYRPAYVRPYYGRPVYAGPRCFWRPARTVWTPYGWRVRPAARICRW